MSMVQINLKRKFKYHDLNEYENRTYPNFCDTAKIILKDIFKVLN